MSLPTSNMLDCGTDKQASIDRRAVLWRCLSFLGLCSSLASGALARQGGYRKLDSPVVLPLEDVAEAWHPYPFNAYFSAQQMAGGPSENILLKGVVLRMPQRSGTELKAFCLHCPHELCFVNFTEDAELGLVAPAVEQDHPLFVCPCHFSVFDPLADGARVSGPADRGLYRFRLRVRRSGVEIVEVEKEALGS